MVRRLAFIRTLLPLSLLFALSAILVACSGGSDAAEPVVPSGGSISIVTVTPAVIQNGGKAETPPTASAGGSTASASTPASTATRAATASASQTPGSGSTATSSGAAPTSGRWIDVDVTRFVVRLMNGSQTVQTISPVAVGEKVNTGEYESTQTGLFYVYNKIAGLQYDAPYDAYIADWVAFDPAKDNGFHSFLLDSTGAVDDPSTGRISNGCIRTGASRAIFDYAEIGMAVYVHL